jgi:predicted type IV restriction endonuclease
MDFIDRIEALAARIPQQIGHIRTEEATKNALVLPFINALGYNVFDPTEVVPEFIADVGIKKGEKVDYAIFQDGKPIILFECKTIGTNLATAHASQLYRYFTVTDAPIAVLTNGTQYNFFTDLDEPNRMDNKPFLVIDLMDIEKPLIAELKKLSKGSFSVDELIASASDLKYTREVKRILQEQLDSPSEDFVKFLGAQVYEGRMTQNVREEFAEIVKQAFNQFITEKVNERLQTALSTTIEMPQQAASETADEPEIERVITTSEELEGYFIIKALLRDTVDPERIVHRDTQSYFGVLLDDNNRKPICRLHFNSEKVKYVVFFNEKREPERVDIASLNDLYKHGDKLKTVVTFYERTEGVKQ